MGAIVIGIDHGNGNMKTVHTAFPCGFKMQETQPSELFAKDVIAYKDAYYSLSTKRFPYTTDKTANENSFILTLFAIAKELVARVAEGKPDFDFKRDFSGFIGKDVVIAIGLPPAHFEKQKEPFKKYFEERTRYGLEYTYNGKHFNFHIKDIFVYPQDYAAAVVFKSNMIAEYSAVYCIDIGDGTVDMVGLVDGVPEKETMISREIGMSHLRSNIIDDVINDYNVTLNDSTVEDFLAKRPLGLDPSLANDIENRIRTTTSGFTTNLINQLHSKVPDFRVYPTVFCGGGANLLKEYISNSGQFGIIDFIEDIHANAIGYERLAGAMLNR